MRGEVSEEFFVGVAGIAATLIGTFLVGTFFYLDSELHRVRRDRMGADRYMRSAMRGVFVIYAIPLVVPLALVSLDAVWVALVFVAISAVLLAVTVDAVSRLVSSGGRGVSVALVVNEVVADVGVGLMIILPWVLGGWVPPPSAFIPSLLLALGLGFLNTTVLVMTLFGAPRGEPAKE